MNIQTKFLQDENGVKYAPITTPNAVRYPDGSNLNDKLYTKSETDAVVAAEKLRAENEEEALRQLYENLTQSDIVVVEDHTAVSSPSVNIIYREQGETSYIDWMWYNSAWKKMAEYDNGIDNEPVKDSDNFVKSGGVYKYTSQLAGEPSTFHQFTLSMTDGKFIRPNGTVDSISGTATSDLIDISQYADCDIYVMFPVSLPGRLGYALYNEDGTFISGEGQPIASWKKLAITSNTKYVRVSSTSANINNIALYAMNDAKDSYQSLKAKVEKHDIVINSMDTDNTTTIYGEDDSHNFYDGSSSMGYPFFIKLQPAIYTKLKFYVGANATITVDFFAYNEEVGRVIIVASETFTNPTGTRKIIEKDVFLDFSNMDRLSMNISNIGVKFNFSTAPYYGLNFYNGNLGLLYTAEEWDARTPYGNLNIFADMSFSLEYLVGAGYDDGSIVRSLRLSKFFKGKKYVAYGDSIMSTVDGVPGGTYVIPNLIGKFFNLTTVNRGSSGSVPTSSSNLSDANLAYVDADTMLVTISGGQNNWITTEDINSTDRTNCIGAINYFIDQIRLISPKCVIVLCPTYTTQNSQHAIDYQRIAENKKVGIAPTLDLNLINWEYDKTSQQLRYDNIHPTEYGAIRFAAVCTHYLENFML